MPGNEPIIIDKNLRLFNGNPKQVELAPGVVLDLEFNDGFFCYFLYGPNDERMRFHFDERDARLRDQKENTVKLLGYYKANDIKQFERLNKAIATEPWLTAYVLNKMIKTKDLALVKLLLEEKGMHNAFNQDTRTYLLRAASKGTLDIFKYLARLYEVKGLEQNLPGSVEEVNYNNAYDRAIYKECLLNAAEAGNIELVQHLLPTVKRDMQEQAAYDYEYTMNRLLENALKSGDTKFIQQILDIEEFKTLLLNLSWLGESILVPIFKIKDPDFTKMMFNLLSEKINASPNEPLKYAAQTGNLITFDLIMALPGVEELVQQREGDGSSWMMQCLKVAVKNQQPKIVDAILKINAIQDEVTEYAGIIFDQRGWSSDYDANLTLKLLLSNPAFLSGLTNVDPRSWNGWLTEINLAYDAFTSAEKFAVAPEDTAPYTDLKANVRLYVLFALMSHATEVELEKYNEIFRQLLPVIRQQPFLNALPLAFEDEYFQQVLKKLDQDELSVAVQFALKPETVIVVINSLLELNASNPYDTGLQNRIVPVLDTVLKTNNPNTRIAYIEMPEVLEALARNANLQVVQSTLFNMHQPEDELKQVKLISKLQELYDQVPALQSAALLKTLVDMMTHLNMVTMELPDPHSWKETAQLQRKFLQEQGAVLEPGVKAIVEELVKANAWLAKLTDQLEAKIKRNEDPSGKKKDPIEVQEETKEFLGALMHPQAKLTAYLNRRL